MRIMLELVTVDLPLNSQVRVTKALIEASTLTISIHREKPPLELAAT